MLLFFFVEAQQSISRQIFDVGLYLTLLEAERRVLLAARVQLLLRYRLSELCLPLFQSLTRLPHPEISKTHFVSLALMPKLKPGEIVLSVNFTPSS